MDGDLKISQQTLWYLDLYTFSRIEIPKFVNLKMKISLEKVSLNFENPVLKKSFGIKECQVNYWIFFLIINILQQKKEKRLVINVCVQTRILFQSLLEI